MEQSFKKKAITGIAWKYAERMLAQIITTIVSIILARILDPSHYGIIAIVNVFITICNVFVVCGLGESLVQKKDADELDFSTIFYINVGVSIILYLILFSAAPRIEQYYGASYTNLAAILRIMGLRLIFAAVNSIQNAKVSRELDFKKYFYVTLIGTILSAFVGIYMAMTGFGVWALVSQYMTNTIVDTVMLFIFVKWHPHLMFSVKRAKPLAKYGVRILAVAVIDTLCEELRSMVIGKKNSANELAYFSKGNTYPKLIVNNFYSAIASALFPVFAKVQDDKNALQRILKKAITTSSFIIFPLMIELFAVANEFVRVLLTDKWLPCVPYLRMMCVVYMIKPIVQPNCQCLTATGNSGLFAKISILKKAFSLAVLFVTSFFGVFWIALSQVISIVFDYAVSAVVGGNIIDYGIRKQIGTLLPNFAISILMGVAVWGVGLVLTIESQLILLLIEILTGILAYVLLAAVTKNETFYMFIRVMKKKQL